MESGKRDFGGMGDEIIAKYAELGKLAYSLCYELL